MSDLAWLFVDLNSYFAACEQQADPKLRGRPVAVVPMITDTTVAIAASYEAKAFGVKTGTLVGEAKRRCPQIVFVEADHERYTHYHHKIVEAVESCLPVHSVMSIDEMACQLTGSQREPERAITLAKLVKRTILEKVGECLKSSVGIAPNPLLAKMASDMQKPDGLTVLTASNLVEKLHPLSVREIPGVGEKMEERLNRRGIRTIADLHARSKNDLRDVWNGILGERYFSWLRGDPATLAKTQHRSIGHSHVLEPKLREPDAAFSVMKRLLVKAATRLRKENYFTKNLAVHVKFARADEAGESSWDRSVRFDETQDTIFLLKTLEKLWQEFPSDPVAKPFRVGVTFSDIVEQDSHQFSLFRNAKRENLVKSVDAINAKYGATLGKDAIHFASVHEVLESAPTRIAFSRIPKLDEF